MILPDPPYEIPLSVVLAMQKAEEIGARCGACNTAREKEVKNLLEYTGFDRTALLFLAYQEGPIIAIAKINGHEAKSVLRAAGFGPKHWNAFLVWITHGEFR